MDTTVLNSLVKSSQKGYRVDVVELAKKLNLPVYSMDLPDDISGHLCDGDEPYIEVNRNHPVTRQRFTIAHEISHYMQHRDLLASKGKLDRDNTFKDEAEKKIEVEADQIAAGILMPDESIKAFFIERGWNPLTRFTADMITKIADEFKVSKEMAVTRLRDLGIAIPYLTFA